MIIVRSDRHRLHHVPELDSGVLVPSWEAPARADCIADALVGFGPVMGPDSLDRLELEQIHDSGYVDFVSSAWDRWVAADRTVPAAMGFAFPSRRFRDIVPDDLDGQLGYYSFALDCSIGPNTAAAAFESVAIAQTAAQCLVDGEPSAFALCRPPGHHAMRDQFGGYCYLNNAAAAAQRLRNRGYERVGIVDVDYHHGNGTQDIFYERADVVVASIHADPRHQFPYFLGYADENGAGAGLGANLNVPLARGTAAAEWLEALDRVLDTMVSCRVDALVVSLGVDTFRDDPISDFQLNTSDYPTVGDRLAGLGLPTVLVMEGGYATSALGANVSGVLAGFESGRLAADLER